MQEVPEKENGEEEKKGFQRKLQCQFCGDDDLRSCSCAPSPGGIIIPFGANAGKPVSSLGTPYLKQLLTSYVLGVELREAIDEEIRRRQNG